jgi:shikimate kinase
MKNIILIGMPGAGKSTIGVILSKYLAMDFVDTDILIQRYCKSSLQSIIDKKGYLELRGIEEKLLSALSVENTVIATGGSAVYSPKAMNRLKKDGIVVYLKMDMTGLLKRIGNYSTRGIASPTGQTFRSLYIERTKLYRTYGQLPIDCKSKTHEEIVLEIIRKVQTINKRKPASLAVPH